MGQILGRYISDFEKNFGLDFSFTILFCIFALGDICFGEYGLISQLCYIFVYSSF